jgi:hypothetical protein
MNLIASGSKNFKLPKHKDIKTLRQVFSEEAVERRMNFRNESFGIDTSLTFNPKKVK